MKKRKKKSYVSTIILVFVFLVGLSVLLYPTISDLVNKNSQSRAIAGYREQVENLREEEYAHIIESAREYNRQHTQNSFLQTDEEALTEEYNRMLSINGSSLMGYLEITKTGTKLGIYHGVSETVLQVGIGHLPQTSLPVGGESSHCVISGHTGLPSASLLTDLDRMVLGDTFRLYIMGEVYEYEVDQILVVEPTDVEALKIVEGMDYVTVVTCTPYGINSHRLLVRGHGVAWSGAIGESGNVTADAIIVDPMALIPFVAAPILIVFLIWILRMYRKEKKVL